MGVLEHVGDGVDRAGGDGSFGELRQHLGGGEAGGPGGDGGIDFAFVLHAAGVFSEARVGGHVGLAGGAHQPLKDGIAVTADDHVGAVAAGVGIGRHDAGQGRAGGLPHQTGAVVFRHHGLQHVEHRFVDGHVHHLPVAARRLAALDVGQQDAEHRVQPGQRVAQAQVGPHRRLAWKAVQVAETADAFAHRGIAGPLGVRPGLAVSRDARVDQPRIRRLDFLGSEAPFLHGAGAEILDQHVHAVRQLAGDAAPLVGLQVQRDALLVPPQAAPPERRAVVVEQPPAANRVALARRLDFDHLGAEVSEDAAGKRPRQQLAQFEHAHAVQRAGTHRIRGIRSGHGARLLGTPGEGIQSCTWMTVTSKTTC